MEGESPEIYSIDIKVTAADIDLLGHVNNVVYLRYVQDAAVAHWNARASQEEQSKYFWVVTRHEIDYKRPAFKDDEIIARTWVGEAKKGLFERFTELLRKSDQKILAKAKTIWCPIDPKSMRPVEVSASVYANFSINERGG